ncbi:MAG: AbrB/MazE/SpoVT family DNA-binding domain-containing protein [Nanoarchaeota archaeon]|nr:AbrB/MazE/SpoVT family DNA-binding domain-containing protein [Nanoarchaeota archaeon]
MKRKLVKQGATTLMVSLPAKWAKNNNLDKGDEVEIEEIEETLVIKSQKKEVKKETNIKITTGTETTIRTIITNTYRLGYSKVNVEFQNEEEFKTLSNTIRSKLLGFEIISKEKNKCVIENITEPSAEHAENIFLKILYNISQLLEKTEQLFKREDAFEDIKDIEVKIYQYDNFVRRIKYLENNQKTPMFWLFQTELIHAQRDIYFIAKYLHDNKDVNVSKETIEYFKELCKLFEMLKEGYFKRDIAMLEKIHDVEKELVYKKGYDLLSTKKGKEQIIIYRITSSIRGFYLASSPLIGLLLDKA